MSENDAVHEVTLVPLDNLADDIAVVARWWVSIGRHSGGPFSEDIDVMTLLLCNLRARAYEVATATRQAAMVTATDVVVGE